MKKSKILLSLVVIATFVLTPLLNVVYAATSYELGIVQDREGGYAYQISTKDIWKIVAYEGTGYNYDNAIYCIKAGPGFGGTITSPTERRTYSVSRDLKNYGAIEDNYKSILPSDTAVTETIDGQEVSYSKYNAVLWILDNMYLPKHSNNAERQAMRDALLTAAFKEQIDADVTPPFTIDQINLTDDDIEVVQQLAIWHFTNTDETGYDQGDELAAIQIKAKDSSSGYTAFDENSYRQEDSNTLYQYLIKEAAKKASTYGTGDIRKLATPVQLMNTQLQTSYTDDDIIVGPFNLQKQSELDFDVVTKVLDQDQNEVSTENYKVLYLNNEEQKVELESGKTLKDIVGKDFYISVGKNSGINSITLKLTINYFESETTFWTVSGSNEDQPVVIVDKKLSTEVLTAGVNYNFDLALRKFITAVNPVNNQDNVNTRIPTPVVDSNGKVTYTHPKDPVKVESGDIVIYTIRIFNEGRINGYAQEIKDDIPAGLEFLPNHSINTQYGWSLTTDGNSIVTNYLGKDDNQTHLLNAFNYPTMSTPNYDDVKVAFKVIEPNSSKNTIINTAQISDDLDENGNPIEDIDSVPNNNKITEDDIDKEYLILKEFDLALRKFITAVNPVNNEDNVTSRIPRVDVTQLISGESKTATYTHPKTPVPVANGDVVVYTIRIYNEGETSGYAELVKDYIPEGLSFIVENEINQEYRWRLSEDLKSISTDYLSYDRDENNILQAFDKDTMNTLDYKDVKIAFLVTEPNNSTRVLRNIAEVAEDADKNGNPTDDRDSTPDNVNINEYNPPVDNSKYQEDDDDYEALVLKQFDLALRKVIIGVTDETGKTVSLVNEYGNSGVRTINIDQTTIPDTATYKHRKDPVVVSEGDIVEYNLHIYNEGGIDGYPSIIVDQLPIGMESILKTGDTVKSRKGNTYKVQYSTTDNKLVLTLDKTQAVTNIPAYDGSTLSSDTIVLSCKITQRAETNGSTKHYLTNIAYITEEYDKSGNRIEGDRSGTESKPTVSPDETAGELNSTDMDSYKGDTSNQSVRVDTTNSYYYKGEEDDDDFEKVVVMPKEFDLKLIKYISAINGKKSNRTITVDASNLNKTIKGVKVTTANYNVTKVPMIVKKGDLVTYTFRIYNEGNVSGYAKQITEDIPSGLEYVASENTNPSWTVSNDGKTISTDYLSREKGTDNLIKAYDGETLSYKEVSVTLRVLTDEVDRIIRNEAEISDDEDENGNSVTDRDSRPEEWNKQNSDTEFYENNRTYPKYVEDDEDYDNIKLAIFDLALRKFITAVEDKEVTTRIPQVTVDNEGNITYTHPKDPVLVHNGDLVTYTLRIYNEGTIDGYAEIIKDDIPAGLEFLPDNAVNKAYGWQVSEDGKSITTDYLSSAKSAENLIKAFQRSTMQTPEYKDVKVVFKVTEEQIPSDRILINTAEIAKDKNEYDAPDKDSIPNNNNEWGKEDDLDIEKVKVQYFDLALLKWVNKVIVTEDGKTTERDTGHTGLENPEPIVKVDLDKRKLKKTTVKFEYTIKITNEGQIAGYAKEISDYIPDGLQYVQEDNPLWTLSEGKVVTRQLENTLLQPGESATVKIILTWINDANNLALKVNTAEISEDYNDYGSKDIDSTPNNQVEGEDDIDTAPVILSLKTGQDRIYYVLIGTVLVTIAAGVILIKKYVL